VTLLNARRADRKLHMDLLRARGAADRLELAMAVHDLSDQLAPLRRAAEWIGLARQTVGASGRSLGWAAAALAALARGRWLGRALGSLAAGIRSTAAPRTRIVAAFTLAAAVALIVRRARRSGRGHPTDRSLPLTVDSNQHR
jgi:hypothetical protein